jgi:hypothetical protein
MRGTALRRVLVICVIGLAAFLLWPRSRLTRQFSGAMPTSARLDYTFHRHAGLSDNNYAFRFTVTDDALRDKLIADWKLIPFVDVMQESTSFISLKPPPWWPVARLETLPERYVRDDDANERYWNVWVDRENGWLYAEHGNW